MRELQRHLEDDEVGMILPKKWGRGWFSKKESNLVVISYYFLFLTGEMIQFYFWLFFQQKSTLCGPQFSSICENAGFHTVHLLTHKKICGPRPSRLEKEMFLLPDASGGSNSRLFVVPPWCPARDAMAAESMDGIDANARKLCYTKNCTNFSHIFFQTSKGNAAD